MEMAVPLLVMPESAICDAKHKTGRAGNTSAKQERTLGVLLLVTVRCKMTELGAETFGFGIVTMHDCIREKKIRLRNLVNQVVSQKHCLSEYSAHHT